MRNLPMHDTRRKRLTGADASSTSQSGGAAIGPTIIGLILFVALAIWLIAPGEVDDNEGRTKTTISDSAAVTTQVWQTVASTFEFEDAETRQVASLAAPKSPESAIKPNETIKTGATSRTVLTRGNDLLELDPHSSIDLTEADASAGTNVHLTGGTVHVKAAKRTDGSTLSVETKYLVATVKGTKFEVTTVPGGAAVSVTEGIVAVTSVASGESVDLTRGRTAVVLANGDSMPRVIATLPGGALAGIDAITAGTVSNSNHHGR